MTLILLVFLGGVLSILSPCILPVIPFVFARGDQPFLRTGVPLLLGMALSFAAVATLAAVAGGWAVEANQYGRYLALLVLGLFALTLLSERLAATLARPLVRLGDRLWHTAEFGRHPSGPLSSFFLGVATGLLWAPCAGPILGLVLTTAALKGASVGTSFLLLAYALGAAGALAVILLAGSKLLGALKRQLGFGTWIRRGLGAAVLATVVAVAAGADTDFLSQTQFVDTTPVEHWLVETLGGRHKPALAAHEGRAVARDADAPAILRAAFVPTLEGLRLPEGQAQLVPASDSTLPVERQLPSLSGATEWLNSSPLSTGALRGKVVLVEFWTYACINCRHVLPHIKAWADKYRDAGLVVVGVHTPELAFEKLTANVRRAVAQDGITFPVAVDTNSTIWQAFDNEFWPAMYFADTRGRIRYHHFGEEDYRNQERVIQQLLTEAGSTNVPGGYVSADDGKEVASEAP